MISPIPLTRPQIDQAVENYRYASELMASDERVDNALGEDIMNRMTLDEVLIAGFEITLQDEFNGDFRAYCTREDLHLWEGDLLEFFEFQYPEYWAVLQKLRPFQ